MAFTFAMKNITAISLVLIIAATAFIVIPSFFTGIPNAARTIDMHNLRQIRMAVDLYAKERDGEFPNHFGELFDPDIDIFSDPESAIPIFQRHGSPRPAESIDNILHWTDWGYIPGHTIDSPPDSIVLFLPPGHHFIDENPVALVVTVDGDPRAVSIDDFTMQMNTTLQTLQDREPDANQTR